MRPYCPGDIVYKFLHERLGNEMEQYANRLINDIKNEECLETYKKGEDKL